MSERTPTPAQRFRDNVWDAGPEQLSTAEAMVLLAYADHCRDGGDTAWVAQERLLQRCKLRSKGTPAVLLARLVQMGWLELLDPARWRNKKSPVYRLLPDHPRGIAPSHGEVKKRTPPPRPTGQTAPSAQPDRPVNSAQSPRQVAPTAPSHGANRPVNRTPPSGESPSSDSPRVDAAAMLRTATPPEPQNPDAAGGPLMSAEEAKAQLRALGIGRRRAETSHWKVGTAPVGEPNPLFDPQLQARLVAEAYGEAAS
jgi:hypothetical protein